MPAINDEKRAEVIKYLNSWANLSDFYLRKFPESSTYLINYIDSQGESWTLMEDDDDFLDLCIKYLKEIGAQEFLSSEDMENFIQGITRTPKGNSRNS